MRDATISLCFENQKIVLVQVATEDMDTVFLSKPQAASVFKYGMKHLIVLSSEKH